MNLRGKNISWIVSEEPEGAERDDLTVEREDEKGRDLLLDSRRRSMDSPHAAAALAGALQGQKCHEYVTKGSQNLEFSFDDPLKR